MLKDLIITILTLALLGVSVVAFREYSVNKDLERKAGAIG